MSIVPGALVSAVKTVSLLAFVVVSSACSSKGDAATTARRPGGAPSVPVTVAAVDRRTVPLTISAVGTAEAYSVVAVRSQITGALMAVNFKEGEEVSKGQELFTLDRRPLEAALLQAQATLQRDSAQAANAKAIAARYQDLQARGIASREQADQSRTAASALEATVQADEAAVENARVQLQYATIAAPLSGRTGALMVHAGNLVRANDTTPLVVINQVAPIFVSFGVPEGQLSELRRYQARGAIRVEAAPPGEGSPSVGRITFVDNAVDATTGQIRVKAEFSNADRRLWPGQFVNVTVVLSSEPDSIVVPTAAVQTGQQGPYVFVVKDDMTVDLRPITLRRQIADATVVDSGVAPGETVVTDGQLRLVAGTKVSVKPGGPGGAEGTVAAAASTPVRPEGQQ